MKFGIEFRFSYNDMHSFNCALLPYATVDKCPSAIFVDFGWLVFGFTLGVGV